MKKTMNKVIAATMMAITLAMPAMAGNKKYANNRNTTSCCSDERQEGIAL